MTTSRYARPPSPPSTNTNTNGTNTNGISLRGLTKTFSSPQGPVLAVRGVNLDIAPGETVALLGPNGAGKSTTIDMLLGLLPADQGDVSVFGMSPKQAIRVGAIGAMLQSGQVLKDLTVRELIAMMASLYQDPLPVAEVMALGNIADIAGRRTDKLSGGQAQRVRFAVALVSNPDLIVLDEPTVAMDVEARHAFWATMRGFTERGKTVIFATHYLEEADAYADRVVLMARGEIVADGTASEIKASVGGRTIRVTLDGADTGTLKILPGVRSVTTRGATVSLACSDSDQALRALLQARPDARDIEISAAGLEEAFMKLTVDAAASASGSDAR
jgi:ABC-2 type transport system ATP-binding protein